MTASPIDDTARWDIPQARAAYHADRAAKRLAEECCLDDLVLVYAEIQAALKHLNAAIARAAREELQHG